MTIKSFKIEDLPGGRKKTKWSRRKRAMVAVAVVIPVLALGGALTYYLTCPKAPDPTKMETKAAVKYMASKQFAALPESEKESYMARIRAQNGDSPRFLFNNDLTREERDVMRRNTRTVMQKEMKARMKKFFAMSKVEREAEIDRIAKEWQTRRAQRAQGQGGQQGGRGQGDQGGPPGGGNPTARMQQMLEGTDSTTRAQMAEFHKMMHQRMQPQTPPPR